MRKLRCHQLALASAPDAGWTTVTAANAGAPLGAAAGSAVAPTSAGEEPYAFLVAPRLDAWPALIRFLEAGGRAHAVDEPFGAAGRAWPTGTAVLPRWGNADLTARLADAGHG